MEMEENRKRLVCRHWQKHTDQQDAAQAVQSMVACRRLSTQVHHNHCGNDEMTTAALWQV